MILVSLEKTSLVEYGVNYKIFISYDSKVMAKVKDDNRQDRQTGL